MPQQSNGGQAAGLPATERRTAIRLRPSSLAYVKVGQQNGGIVINVSETGLALTTAETLASHDALPLTFETGTRAAPIQATGEVVWLSESKRTAGLRFVLQTETTRDEIREWIAREKAEDKIRTASAGSVVFNGMEFPAESRPETAGKIARPEAASEESGERAAAIVSEAREAPTVTGPATAQPPQKPDAPAPPSDSAKLRSPEELFQNSPATREASPGNERLAERSPMLFRSLGESFPAPLQNSELREERHMGWFALGSGVLIVLAFVGGVLVGRSMPKNAIQNAAASQPATPASEPGATDSAGPSASRPQSAPQSAAAPPPAVPLSQDTETTGGNAIQVTPPEQGSEPRWISLPQQAVSASDSIAIAVRQSVVVPPAVDEAGDTPLRLEGGRITAAAPSLPGGISVPKNGAILRLRVSLDEKGQIVDVARVTGPAELIPIAEEIVRGWHQTPARLAGKAVASTEDVTVNFRPSSAPAPAPVEAPQSNTPQ